MSTPTCDRIGAELVAFLDGELADDERRPVAAHVTTCLACRQEIDRLTKVQGWLTALPGVEPSPSFAADFWQKVAAEPALPRSNVRHLRPLRWVLPALAAAAVVALALRSELQTSPPLVRPSGSRVEVADTLATAPAKVPVTRVATQPKPSNHAPQLAELESLRPEDLPPELVEHPELFLRLPVVRRLETLEYFGAAHDTPGADDGAG